MRRRVCRAAVGLSLSWGAALGAAAGDGNWPSFRGREAAGVADGSAVPESWSVPEDRNVLWKAAVPGLGHSSPVIWGDRICVTTSVGERDDPELKVGLYGQIEPVAKEPVQRFELLCFDKDDGELLWRRTAHEGVPRVKRHPKASNANSTPATDGEHIVAFFGSEGLYAYDMQGQPLWSKDLGLLDSGFFRVPSAQWGFGSSPVIHEDRVIVQCDVQQDSFLAAFALADGRELWRVAREEVPTWSTPTVHAAGGRTQVLVNGWKHAGGYDLKTGRELWRLRGAGDIPVPTPVVGHGLAFLTHAHGGSGLWAIRLDAAGDVTPADDDSAAAKTAVAWHANNGAYMQTPLVYGDQLYVCRDNGVLSVYDAKTGKRTQQKRLGSGSTGFTASPVAADGKVYFTSETGEVHVLRAGPEPAELAVNDMGEVCMATPAISGGVIYFRTRGHLVAIGERPTPAATPASAAGQR